MHFVHLIDKMDDQRAGLVATAACGLEELFAPEYPEKGYAKTYRGCRSRLRELLAETEEA